MKITAIREATIPLRSEIRNSAISFAHMTTSAVVLETDVVRDGAPVTGYGFGAIGRYAQGGLLRERFLTRLGRAAPGDLLEDDGSNISPEKAWRVMMTDEKPGGHGDRAVAVGAVDMALWDLAAKIAGKPLYQFLAFRHGLPQPAPAVRVYAAGGYYDPAGGVTRLQAEIRGYLDQGFTAVKIKIGGAALAEDLRRVEAVLSILPPGAQLAVDANGRLPRAAALACTEALNAYPLLWLEEPGDPLDFELNREVVACSTNPIATGENLFSVQDARNLVRYGGMNPARDFLQMDPVLAYGLVEYHRILAMAATAGWPKTQLSPHGGIQFALHVAAAFGLYGSEAYPGVFQPAGGFATGAPVENGRVRLTDAPGIGIELKNDLYRVFQEI